MTSSLPAAIPRDRTGPHEERYFRFQRATQSSDLEAIFRIRYQVYCLERGFLPQADYPSGLESDDYDAAALHILATHRGGQPAGTARLVTASPLGFPLMRHCLFAGAYAHLNDPAHPSLARFAEISRLAVSKLFRRREGDTPYGGLPRADRNPPEPEGAQVLPLAPPRNTPEILMGLSRLLYQESKRLGITHWMQAMERSLFLMLKRMGITYTVAGPEVDYYGPVRPYVVSIEALEVAIHRRLPATFAYMVNGLAPDLLPPHLRLTDGAPDEGERESAGTAA